MHFYPKKPNISVKSTASANIDRTPLSLRILFTRRLGRSNIEPIFTSRIRRTTGGVGTSGAEWLVDCFISMTMMRSALFEPELCNDRDEGLRVTERHRYNAANHFSISATGGRSVTTVVFDKTLIINKVWPSSRCNLSTRQPRKSGTIHRAKSCDSQLLNLFRFGLR